MILYGLPTCDRCRTARKALPQARFVDVRADGVPEDVLAAAFDRFGEALLNTRSATWRALPEAERALPPLALLARHPLVMKRPLIAEDGRLYLGWDAETRAALGAA